MVKPKLILGTAEFGPKPYGTAKEPIALQEIDGILTLASKGGITILEGAEAYGCDAVLQNPKFDVIYKVTHPYSLNKVLKRLNRTELMGLMYHHGYKTAGQRLIVGDRDNRCLYYGASIYQYTQHRGFEDIVEVPLNLEDNRFEKFTAPVKLVRSVFGRGELLKKYTVKECLDYVKSVPNVHGVVVGVNSKKELEEILKEW